MPKITKWLVEAAEVREQDYIICDNELRGFAVRVLPSGKRCYLVRSRIGTRYRHMSIGQHDALTAETGAACSFQSAGCSQARGHEFVVGGFLCLISSNQTLASRGPRR